MKDLEIMLENKPGSLAKMGEALGKGGISLEGGGVFEGNGHSIAHFLVEDAEAAQKILAEAGIKVTKITDVVIQRLRQDVPGQLGMFCRSLAEAGVNVLTQYSDHANRLIIVPDDYDKAQQISEAWTKQWW